MRRRFLVKLGGKIIKILKLAASSSITPKSPKEDMAAGNSPLAKSLRYMMSPRWSILRLMPDKYMKFMDEMKELFNEINRHLEKLNKLSPEDRKLAIEKLKELNDRGREILRGYGLTEKQFGNFMNYGIRYPEVYWKKLLEGVPPHKLDWESENWRERK
jgi:hypothetical protein